MASSTKRLLRRRLIARVPIKMIKMRPKIPTRENTTPERTLFCRNPTGACAGGAETSGVGEPEAVTVKVVGGAVEKRGLVREEVEVVSIEVVGLTEGVSENDDDEEVVELVEVVGLEVVEAEVVGVGRINGKESDGVGKSDGTCRIGGIRPGGEGGEGVGGVGADGVGRGSCRASKWTTLRYSAPIKVARPKE